MRRSRSTWTVAVSLAVLVAVALSCGTATAQFDRERSVSATPAAPDSPGPSHSTFDAFPVVSPPPVSIGSPVDTSWPPTFGLKMVMAKSRSNGELVVQQITTRAVAETRLREVTDIVDGEERTTMIPETTIRHVTEKVEHAIKKKFDVFEIGGKKLSVDKAKAAMKRQRAVLLVQHPGHLVGVMSPLSKKFFRDDVLIVCLHADPAPLLVVPPAASTPLTTPPAFIPGPSAAPPIFSPVPAVEPPRTYEPGPVPDIDSLPAPTLPPGVAPPLPST